MSAHSRLPALLVILIVSGCATTGAPSGTRNQGNARWGDFVRFDRADWIYAESHKLIEEASPAALTEAARLIGSSEVAGSPLAADLEGLGRRLFRQLYPEIENPFSPDATEPAETSSVVSGFFARIDPALVILDPGVKIDADQAADLKERLALADGEDGASVLPPYLQALLFERQGKADAMERSLLEESLHRAPSFYPAMLKIADIIIAQGKAAEELPLLERLASGLPTGVLSYGALARATQAAGQPQRAADAAARALLLAPDVPDFVILRASAFEALGDWYQAIWLLDALLKQKPDESRALLMKARLLYEKAGDDEQALRVLSSAEALFSEDPGFPELRGRILLEMRNSEEGVRSLTRSLELDPGRVAALGLLAREAARLQRWSQAAEWLARIPEGSQTADDLQLGWQVATSLGDHEQALAFARALAKKSAGDTPLLLESRSLLAAGRAAQALEAIAKALPAAKTPRTRSSLYVVKAAAGSQSGGKRDDALADLREALLEDPDNVEALLAISDLLSGQHEYRKALGYAKRAAELSPGDASLPLRVGELEKLAQSE